MEDYFSIGELSRYQNISKQTLIFYDKLGLFQPAYVDPNNGYRYYTARQLDELDTILILKKSGLSLQRIKELLEHYTTESSQKVLREQLGAIDRQMEELRLLRSRLSQRYSQLEDANLHKGEPPRLEMLEEQYLLTRPVEAPYSLREISIATKQCFAQAFQEELPIFFQSGVRVPLERILAKRYTEASTAFLPIEKTSRAGNIQRLPGGLCATLYHRGDYLSIGATYERLLAFCRERRLKLLSDSYEFCVNDYITTGDESEYITQILFFVEREAAVCFPFLSATSLCSTTCWRSGAPGTRCGGRTASPPAWSLQGNAALPRSSSGKPWGWWRGSTGKRALPWCSPRTNCFFR